MDGVNQNQMWDETHQNNVPGSINGIPKWDANEVDPDWDLPLGTQMINDWEELENRPNYPDIGSNPTSKWDTNGNDIPDYLIYDTIDLDPPSGWENEGEDEPDFFEVIGKAFEDSFDSNF